MDFSLFDAKIYTVHPLQSNFKIQVARKLASMRYALQIRILSILHYSGRAIRVACCSAERYLWAQCY